MLPAPRYFMHDVFRRFLHDTSGATAIEYSLIAGLIALVCIGAFTVIGTKLSTKFNAVARGLS